MAIERGRRTEAGAVLGRIDRWPPVPMLLGGLAVGALVTAGALATESTLALLAPVALLLAAMPLGLSGEMVVAEDAPSEPAEKRPSGGVEETPLVPPPLLEMVALSGGTFRMGSPEGEEGLFDDEVPHEVTVSPFAIARWPVTRRQWHEVTNKERGTPEEDEVPVTQVNWFDAIDFCNALSAREGLRACYVRRGDTVTWDRHASGYRLPTEAEWEYACRGGTHTRFGFGDDEARLGEYAWYGDNAQGRIQPVATRKPNAFGLHDMHGNVWEWCWDLYGPYDLASPRDPTGPTASLLAGASALRVVRGGFFRGRPWDRRAAFRDWFRPVDRSWGLGFRCVRGVSGASIDR